MKLLRYGPFGKEKPGILDSAGKIRDLSKVTSDLYPDVISVVGQQTLRSINPETLPLVEGNPRIGAPIAQIGKVVCVGLNYSDHAAESGMPVPKEPIIFMKANTSISGPNDAVMIPRDSKKSDWEVELGVVIGRITQHAPLEEALNYVAGYCVVNDVSEREFQIERGGQWVKGKSCDSFCPIGPWLVTKDEVPDPQNLDMWLEVNGHRYQNGNTKTMVFNCAHLVSYISKFMTLMPGDVISTGTPPGVGLGVKPNPVFLKVGDVMRLGIHGLGEQRQECVPWKPLG
jgi:2-keto-4-pentenoate hydratase/2-oxohepta-3-ene-1,7-dioic acid hydratase in catechol pathway